MHAAKHTSSTLLASTRLQHETQIVVPGFTVTLLNPRMKEEYEDRLQRAKIKLQEEKARRHSRGQRNDSKRFDDASYCSEVSKTSKTSYTSEYSRTSSIRDTKGPRSEWRNKAMAVIERGKGRKEEAELLRDDASLRSGKSSSYKDREAEVDSLVERNARLNERERLLKVESDLLDAAEAAARAENRARAEAFLGKDILDEPPEDEESLASRGSVATTRTTASVRAKRIRDDEADELNRSFQQAKAVWQVRCKDEPGDAVNDPTPVKSNSHPQPSESKKNKLDLEPDLEFERPGTPGSTKSARSTRSSKSLRASRSFRSENRYSKQADKARSKSSDKIRLPERITLTSE